MPDSNTVAEATGPRPVPQIVTAGDTARTRRTDPLSSHVAGDLSQRTVSQVEVAVLAMIAVSGPMDGNQLNDKYRAWREGRGWPVVHYDSPRKRAGELAAAGLLAIVNEFDLRGVPRIYALPESVSAVAA